MLRSTEENGRPYLVWENSGRLPGGGGIGARLKGVEDCCSRYGGRLLWVTKAWEQKKELHFGWEKTGKGRLAVALPFQGQEEESD